MSRKERLAAKAAQALQESTEALVPAVEGESPDERAAAVAQLDPQLFRDAESQQQAAAEVNEARRQWASGPGRVLAGVR